MGSMSENGASRQEAFGYLCVDAFLRSMVGVQALKSALELGVIDRLNDRGAATFDGLVDDLGGDRSGLRVLCDLLLADRVLEEDENGIAVGQSFAEALRYRELLEVKIDFANLVAPDLIDHFTLMVNDPGAFMERARVFSLFDYRRCFDRNQANYESTKRWVRFTTALTTYETGVCAHYHDFSGYQRMLDIGGNSGEFVLQVCKRHPGLCATVFDLPVVCDIGEEHVGGEPEAGRIGFVRGDALTDEMPAGFDLVSFKSMLHDWPDELAMRLLVRAAECLRPGGTILIFERGPMRVGGRPLGYSLIPMLLFFRSFRNPAVYQRQLEELGFSDIQIHEMDLETPFFLITAKKG